jgi:hypothetical protein
MATAWAESKVSGGKGQLHKLMRRRVDLWILGRGGSVIGGTIRTELAYAELEATLVDGFFPRCRPGDLPKVAGVLGSEMGRRMRPILASRVISFKFLTRQRTGSRLTVVRAQRRSL